MASVLIEKTKAAIRKSAEKHCPGVKRVSHVYPRAYCLGRQHGWACFAVPPQDDKGIKGPFRQTLIHVHGCHLMGFPDDLKTGDWCAIGYIVRASSGVHHVIHALEP